MDKSAWIVHIFDDAPSETEGAIRCNDLVLLMDPEASTFLHLPPPVINTGEKSFYLGHKRRQSTHTTLFTRRDGGKDATMHFAIDAGKVDSNCYFVIEGSTLEGGKVSFEELGYRLRHINSGLYLTLARKDGQPLYPIDNKNALQESEDGQAFRFTSSTAQRGAKDFDPLSFKFSPAHMGRAASGENEQFVESGSAIVLGACSDTFFEMGGRLASTGDSKYSIFASNVVSKRANASSLVIVRPRREVSFELLTGVAAVNTLISFKASIMNEVRPATRRTTFALALAINLV